MTNSVIERAGRHRAADDELSTMEWAIARQQERWETRAPHVALLPAGRDWLASLVVSVVAAGAVTAIVTAALIAAMNAILGVAT